MRHLLSLLLLLCAVNGMAQSFPTGTYYMLPKSSGNGEWKIREITFYRDSVVERYVDLKLKNLHSGEMKTIAEPYQAMLVGSHCFQFYTRSITHLDYSSMIINGESLAIVDSHVKYPLKGDLEQVIYNLIADTTYDLKMPVYSKKEIQHFLKFTPILKAKKNTIKKIMETLSEVQLKENQLARNAWEKFGNDYKISRFHDISYLKCLVEEGVAPFLQYDDIQELHKKYSDDKDMVALLDTVTERWMK